VVTLKRPSGSFFEEGMPSGRVVIMLGFMRSGKTNFSVVLMDQAAQKGYKVFCNTHFFRPEQIEQAKNKKLLNKNINYKVVPENITVVTTAYQLLKGLHKHQLGNKQSLVFLDEASLFAGSTMGMQTRVRWLKNLIVTIGKLNSSIMLIWQAKSSVIPMLREELVSMELLIKKKGSHRMCEVRSLKEGDKRLVWCWYSLPETRLPYDTRAISEFVFDIDSDYLFAEVSKYNTLDMVDKFLPVLEKSKEIQSLKDNNNKKEKKPTIRSILKNELQDNPRLEWEEAKKKKGLKDLKRDYFYRLRQELGIG